MAVYEMNIKDLARFISDTKFGFMPIDVDSTIGYRTNGESRYKIDTHEINCNRIIITNDCFINTDGNIVVASYIPAIEYRLKTNEFPPYYNIGKHLVFDFKTNSFVLEYKIEKDIILDSFNDFRNCMDKLIDYIGENIEEAINCFNYGKDGWDIYDVDCSIYWSVSKTKTK